MNKSADQFVEFVRKECDRYGIKFKVGRGKYLKLTENGKVFKVSGYFDDEAKVLAVARNHKMFLEVLAHEYCHLTQWVDQCLPWKKMVKSKSIEKVWGWLSGEEVRNIESHLKAVAYMELDNEKRTTKLIKRFNLPIDLDVYIQKSNSYVMFYHHMEYTRKFCTAKNSPYKLPELYGQMSTKFNMKYTGMSKRVKKIYDKVYLNEA
jgi:hypothetical protein